MTPDELRAEVERLTRELQVERCGVRPIDELLERVTTDRDELHVAWKREREEVERLTRERDSARDRILEYTDALVERDAEIASLTAALDERDLEAERGLEQYDRLMHQLADKTNEATHWQVMLKRETEEVERLRDENAHRREMLRRETEANERLRKENDAIAAEVERLRREVDAMAAELHALSVKYDARDNESANAYRRGAKAMRDECIGAACGFFMGTTGFCNGDEDALEAVLEALPIPEEP